MIMKNSIMNSKNPTYTIERVTPDTWSTDFTEYLLSTGPELSKIFDHKLNWENAQISSLVDNKNVYFLIGRRDGKICGHLIGNLFRSPLDSEVKILYQLSFYVKPES